MIVIAGPVRRVRGGISRGAMYRWEVDYDDGGDARTMAFESETEALRFYRTHQPETCDDDPSE